MTKYKCERTYIDSNIDRSCKRDRYWKMIGKFLAMTALGSLLLTGCGAKVDVPDMSSMGTINVVSREEGSGTKTEFDNLVGTDATEQTLLQNPQIRSYRKLLLTKMR